MLGHPAAQPHHHRRFYILITTVVVGAILILMLLNDKGDLSLTGSTIGMYSDEGAELSENDEAALLKELNSKETMDFKFGFDSVPSILEKETKMDLLRIMFDDLNNKIKINEEELDLKGLKDVELMVSNFKGEVEFDEISLSLKGEGDKVVINGIEISTKGLMEISMRNLVYDTLEVLGLKIGAFETEEGRGELGIGEKLNYDLDFESVAVQGFKGDLSVGLNNDSLLMMNGIVRGIAVEGEFDLTLS